MKLRFALEKLADQPYVQDFFKTLQNAVNSEPILTTGFKFFQITVPSAATNQVYPHNLRFIPKDILLTFITEGASVTWHTNDFTDSNLYFTTTGACTIRAFIGTYSGGA